MAKKPGPPATGKGVLVGVRLQPDLLDAVERYAEAEEDKPGRPEAVRRIVKAWLAEHGHLGESKGG